MRLTTTCILILAFFCPGPGLPAGAVVAGPFMACRVKEKVDNGLSLSGDHTWFLEVDEEETHGGDAGNHNKHGLAAVYHAADEPTYNNGWHLQKIFLSLHMLYCTFLN